MQQCPLPTDQTGALLMTKKLPEKIAETSVPVAALIAARSVSYTHLTLPTILRV